MYNDSIDKEINTRYSRQILYSPIGRKGQEKLLKAHVTIVGMGALGTVLSNHMVRAGVGHVRIIDRDFVEESNLQRQMLYDEKDATNNMPKVIAAEEKLSRVNSHVDIEPVIADINSTNAEKWLTDTDLILDATDNFQVRFLINDVSLKHRIPWIYGGVVSAKGVFAMIRPYETPCFRCLFHEPPPPEGTETCDTAGVLGPLVHIVASYQATEALKWLVDDKKSLNLDIEYFEIWKNKRSKFNITKALNPDCPTCVHQEFEYLNSTNKEEQFTVMCGRDTVQITPSSDRKLDLDKLAYRCRALGKVEQNKFLLRFQVEPYTMVFFTDGRVLIQGTEEMGIARSLYAKYVGM